jgi:tripartite-type tricarboxylate transporter receptor subunit TctC
MSPLRFRLSLLCALLVGALLPAEAGAQNYPDHAITMIVPFAVGGLTDVPVRIGQTVIVENKPGGSGTLGGAYAARAAPRRLHSVRQFDRRRAEPVFHSSAL